MKNTLLILLIALISSFMQPAFAEKVIYNPNSGIYHSTNCASATRCKSCIKIEKQDAIKKGARACKKCGK